MRFKSYWGRSFKVEQAPALNKKNKKEYLARYDEARLNGDRHKYVSRPDINGI